MGMTIAEKILAAHSGRTRVRPGEFILAEVDLTLANDITAPLAIRGFREAGGRTVRRPKRIALVVDHFVPCKDIESAAQGDPDARYAEERTHREALRRGIMEIFLNVGAVVAPPTCGPYLEGHMGVLATGERALAATNRIFFRNALNLGLPLRINPEAPSRIRAGDLLEVDPAAGRITNLARAEEYPCQPLVPFMIELVRGGGLLNLIREGGWR